MKSIYEKELMVIIFTILKWCYDRLGRKIALRTDQSSLKFFLEQREVGVEYQNTVTRFMGFDFDIVFDLGASNKVVDALTMRA